MDVLINKKYEQYDYTSRYTGVPYYFNTQDRNSIYGIGTNMYKTTNYYTHALSEVDTLDSLALKYYNNPTFWWIIAYFNDILDPFEPLIKNYTALKIPAFSAIKFGDEK